MRRKRHRLAPIYVLLTVAILLLGVSVVLARSDSSYDLSWWTVDGGGGTGASSGYTLNGTTGQPDTGVLSGRDYALAGGYWAGAAQVADWNNIYLPLITR